MYNAMFVSFPYGYIYLNPDRYLGFSKQICFSLLVRSRGAPPLHVYPLGVHWMQHPGLTWVVGGFSLVHSFRLPLSNLQHLYILLYYLVWTLFSVSLWSWFFCGSSEIPLLIWTYRNVNHVEDMYGIFCSFSVYIRTRVVPCLGKKHLAISTNKNVGVVSNWHLVNIWCSNPFVLDYS